MLQEDEGEPGREASDKFCAVRRTEEHVWLFAFIVLADWRGLYPTGSTFFGVLSCLRESVDAICQAVSCTASSLTVKKSKTTPGTF